MILKCHTKAVKLISIWGAPVLQENLIGRLVKTNSKLPVCSRLPVQKSKKAIFQEGQGLVV